MNKSFKESSMVVTCIGRHILLQKIDVDSIKNFPLKIFIKNHKKVSIFNDQIQNFRICIFSNSDSKISSRLKGCALYFCEEIRFSFSMSLFKKNMKYENSIFSK